MQILKDDIRRRILAMARRHFIHSGMKNTSIHTIAKDAGVAVGNIYNYFRSKNEIFTEVLRPLLIDLDKYLLREKNGYYQTLEYFSVDEMQTPMVQDMLEIIDKHRPEFRLLMFEATGTPLENYFDRYAERLAETGMEYLNMLKKKFPHINVDVSPLFIKANCALWLFILKTIIQHDDISKSEVEKLISDYVQYGTAGWKKLLNV